MAQPLNAPYSYFTDANGLPLAGGKVYTYVAGTLTPQNSYTDSSGVTPASNPVVLDSAGKATIWLSGLYKIIVKDSLGNTISTTDNITASTSTGDMNTSVYDAAAINEQLVGLSATQTLINKTLTNPNIIGAATNSSANPGSVGEFVSAICAVGNAVSLTNNTSANLTSMNLTAGDWDVWGTVAFTANASTTAAGFSGGVSTTSNTLPDPTSGARFSLTVSQGANVLMPSLPTGAIRINVPITTTIYLVAQSSFAVSTMSGYGVLMARRRR